MGEIGGDIAESACFRTFGKQTTKESLRNPKNSAKFGRIRPIPQIYHEKGRFLRTDRRTDGRTHFGPQSWGTNYLAHQNINTNNNTYCKQYGECLGYNTRAVFFVTPHRIIIFGIWGLLTRRRSKTTTRTMKIMSLLSKILRGASERHLSARYLRPHRHRRRARECQPGVQMGNRAARLRWSLVVVTAGVRARSPGGVAESAPKASPRQPQR